MTTAADLVLRARQKIREITPQEVCSRLDKILVVDVREPEEYAAGRIPGALNIPRGVLEFRLEQHPALYDREREIVLHCQGGGRSALAAATLQELGYRRVSSMAGGFGAWEAAGLPVEK